MAPLSGVPASRKVAILGGVLVAAAVGGWVFFTYFAPQASRTVDEALPETGVTRLAGGDFSGADPTHEVSGNVTLYRDDEGHFLRFERYDATAGPAVYFFLSESAEGEYDDATVRKLLAPGGEVDGQATLRGHFNIRLPDGHEPTRYKSLIVYCERFGVTFGSAPIGTHGG